MLTQTPEGNMLFHYSDPRSKGFKPLKQMISEGRDPLITRDKTIPLKTRPHYSDKAYRDPNNDFGKMERHLFLSEGHKLKNNGFCIAVDGAHYDYSDRLNGWDNEKSKEAWAEAEAHAVNWPLYSAEFYEDYLSYYYGHAVKLVHVIAGIDGGGYPYQVFGSIKVG